jgi:Phage tail protein
VSFPDPSLTPPDLPLYAAYFNGLQVGGVEIGNAYPIVTIEGLDGIPISGGDQQRPLDTGFFAGMDVGGERDITITMIVGSVVDAGATATARAAAQSALADYRQAAAAAFAVPAYVTESPFYIQMENGIFGCLARPQKFSWPLDLNMVQGIAGQGVALVRATDPRFYAVPTKTQTVGLPAPLGGLTFPVTFNASFGGGGTGGLLNVENNGTIEMRPVIIFTGPCTNPSLSNLSIQGNPSIGFDITLNTGDTLTVDTDFQTAVLVEDGTTTGVSRQNLLTPGSQWWNLPVGASTLNFTTTDGTQVLGTCTVESADAFAGL